MRRSAFVLVALLLITGCIPPQAAPSPTPTDSFTSPVPSTPTPLASSTLTTLDMTATLLAKSLPYANGFELTRTVRGRSGFPANGFEPVRTTPPVEDVGATHDFWTYDFAAKKNVKTTVTLRLITDHAKWWVANNATVDVTGLRATASSFESKVYPTDRRLYGEEWAPGIDADPRINVVFARLPGAAAGYFSGSDEEPVWVNEFSAEREMIYLNTLGARAGSAEMDRIIAHEFCHMVQFNTRRRSAVWFNEGHSVLCEKANGFSPTDGEAYLRVPDTQLNDWADLDTARPHYGLAFMFLDYLRQNAGGDDLVRAFLQKGIDTPADFDAVLRQRGQLGVEEQWLNFVAANAFIGVNADRPYTYPAGASARQPAAVIVGDKVETGGTFQSTVREYSVKYVELPRGKITLKFGGPTSNRLIPTDPHSGRTFWWSDRGDGMDATLTKSFDLRTASDPKLAFWTWFGIETDYDYAYVEISTDGGSRWTSLMTEVSTTEDPNGQNLGNGMTGSSSGDTATGWKHLTADLSPFAGKQVQLRFQYVTDGNLNFGGFAVDDIEITGLPIDEAETDNGWTTSGFIRSTNLVSQRFAVQVLHFAGDRATVDRRTVDNGELTFDVDTSGDRRALLAVTAFAVRTTEPIAFSLTAENRP
ncbi:MAG: immune inhibitor A [Chloroflexota bacterium]|nr:immune inhibitor A [Chloroflexota bacterium]